MYKLHTPPLSEVAAALQTFLSERFQNVACSVVECPNLSSPPYNLSVKGLLGTPTISDVGSFDYLLPIPAKEKKYNLIDVFSKAGIHSGAAFGAAAGPFSLTGFNSEMVINLSCEGKTIKNNNSLYGAFNKEDNTPLIVKANSADFALLGQMFMCEGQSGQVIELVVSNRVRDGKLDAFLRDALNSKFGQLEHAVGLGGVIVQEKGHSLYHVLPEFSSEPIDSGEKLRNWIKMFEATAPVVSVGIAVSHDPHKLGLRLEHFHCFTPDQKACGHCHFDNNGSTAAYRAYLSLAHNLVRVDQPIK